jgi:hypothetical protein
MYVSKRKATVQALAAFAAEHDAHAAAAGGTKGKKKKKKPTAADDEL